MKLFPLLFLAVLSCRAQQCWFWPNAGRIALILHNLAMNSRELGLVSAAAITGAAASALAIRFFFSNPKNHFSTTHSSEKSHNGVVSTNTASSQSPFDPSKRKGLDCLVRCLLDLGFVIFHPFRIILFYFIFLIWIWTFRYLSWDDYFMAIAFLSAERSKDPNRQVIIACPNV